MRIPLLQAYVRMLPVLQAREAMAQANVLAYAGGRLKRDASALRLRSWERTAHTTQERPRPELTASTFEAMGIRVEHVKVGE